MNSNEFKIRFLPFYRRIYRVCYAILENSKDAEDATQEVYVKLWEQRGKLDDIQNDEAFVVRITKNLSLDMLREGYRKNVLLVDENRETESEETLETRIHARDDLTAAINCLHTLPASQQKVMQLRHFADMSIPEIAKITQFTEVNIRQLLSRARNTMKERLNQHK